jgi:hypothetical protein
MSVLSDTDAIARVGHAKTYYAYTDGTYSKPGVWFYTRIRTAHILPVFADAGFPCHQAWISISLRRPD